MNIEKLQKKIDKALSILSDHDDKKEQKRYIDLRNKIEEIQEYIDKNNYSHDLSSELYNELKKCMKEFEEDKFVFLIFLVILCGLLFSGVFYITYSHFHDYWRPGPGGHVKPPYSSTTKRTHKTSTTQSTDKTTTKTSTTTTTTKKITSSTSTTEKTTGKVTTSSTTTTTKITSSTTTTKVVEPEDPSSAFVYLIFDNTNLINLDNVYPMLDSLGVQTKPTKWSLTSSLSNSSKNYILTYYIDFVDNFGNNSDENYIPLDKRLNVDLLKYQLLIKKGNTIIHDSGIQDLYDYPEAEEGIRPIISGQTMNNDQSLDFELRMWLDSAAGNDQQGKKYRFEIDVDYTYEFID